MKTFLTSILFVTSIISGPAAETNTTPLSPSVAKDSRCFEMRTYHAAPGKFEAMHARFRDHTCALFKKHGMELVGFWVPTDKDKGADSTLIYLLAHKSRDEAKKSWAAFGNDPEWIKAKAESEANGKLVDKAESVFLSATNYSPLK
ncbi:MAG: NIPSNAP family protein [Verrucomicrobia bacterium]|nr:NIPSNAP family protein [Verrucomicrobiota bacterium]